MFVYQNNKGYICVTFTDNKPVDAPEYIIAVDETTKKLFMVSGTIEALPEQEETPITTEPVIKLPSIEELDGVVENDTYQTLIIAPDTKADMFEKEIPTVDTLDAIEDEELAETAPETKANVFETKIPSVEELDGIVDNDSVVEAVDDVEDETEETDEDVQDETAE